MPEAPVPRHLNILRSATNADGVVGYLVEAEHESQTHPANKEATKHYGKVHLICPLYFLNPHNAKVVFGGTPIIRRGEWSS